LAKFPREDKPRLGQLANSIKKEIETLFTNKQRALLAAGNASSAGNDAIDLTFPGVDLKLENCIL